MSHFNVDAQKPGMRRKSSAQNLLSSFKSSNSASSAPVAPISIPQPSTAPANALSFSSAGSGITPVATTPLVREWDAQSLHSDTVANGLGGAGSPTLGNGTSLEYLRDLVQKRVLTLTYIRNVHEGRSHWFHTILISRSELNKVFNNNDMKRRTHRFTVLGMSLSNILDINQPQDLLRGLLNIVSEYDQSKEDSDKLKMRLFKSKGIKRGGNGAIEYTGSYTESNTDASYLISPHIAFPLDYHQTLMSLLDVLSEVYNKISKLLGPSPLPHSSQHMMGPLGHLSPHPGVSYLFSGDANSMQNSIPPNPNQLSNPNLHQAHPPPSSAGTPEGEMSSSLWSIANPSCSNMAGGSGNGNGGAHASPPATAWTPSLGETIIKIDGKLKKISSTLLKDLDAFARNGIKDELASLDPLLRNVNTLEDAGGGKILYDFEAM